MQRPKLFNNAQDYESVDFMFDDLDWNNAKKDSDEEKDFTAAKSIMNDVFKSTIYLIYFKEKQKTDKLLSNLNQY